MEYEQSWVGTYRSNTQARAVGWMRPEWSDKLRHVLAVILDCQAESRVECLRIYPIRTEAGAADSDAELVGRDMGLPRMTVEGSVGAASVELADLYRARIKRGWEYWTYAGSDLSLSILFDSLGKSDYYSSLPLGSVYPTEFGTEWAIETYSRTDWPDIQPSRGHDRVLTVVVAPVDHPFYRSLTSVDAFGSPAHSRFHVSCGPWYAISSTRDGLIGQVKRQNRSIADYEGVTFADIAPATYSPIRNDFTC